MTCRARLLLCTCPAGDAGRIAEGLLGRHLVACVNAIENVQSRYWWKGALEGGTETLLLMKTESDRVPEVIAALEELHPYEVPELLSVAVEEGAPAYLAWLSASIARDAGPGTP